MSTSLRVSILEWAAWGPYVSGHPCDGTRWVAPGLGEEMDFAPAPAKSIGAGMRRRLSFFGRAGAEVAGLALKDRDRLNLPIVFASRHGDIHRMVELLQQAVGGEAVSPANFSMSVHNAVAGILSIAWSMEQAVTSVSAGADTLAAGFTEALTLCRSAAKRPVLLVYADVALPSVYQEFEQERAEPFALALLLQDGEKAGEAWGELECRHLQAPDGDTGSKRQAQGLAMFLSGFGDDYSIGAKRSGWTFKRS